MEAEGGQLWDHIAGFQGHGILSHHLAPPCSMLSLAVTAVCGAGRHRTTGDFTSTIQRPERGQNFSHPDLV